MVTANMILDLIEDAEETLFDLEGEFGQYDFCNGIRRHIAQLEKELATFED